MRVTTIWLRPVVRSNNIASARQPPSGFTPTLTTTAPHAPCACNVSCARPPTADTTTSSLKNPGSATPGFLTLQGIITLKTRVALCEYQHSTPVILTLKSSSPLLHFFNLINITYPLWVNLILTLIDIF